MSAAAGNSGAVRRRERLRALAGQIDRAMANGRIPALLVAIITGLLLGAFLLTNDYRVESVAVEGVEYGSDREVVDASRLLQQSAFDANVEETVARVAALPYVESVSVEIVFPGRATISIDERTPLFILQRDDGASLVSSGGDVIASGVVDGLPLLQVERSSDLPDDAVTPELVDAVTAIAGIYGPGADLIWSEDVGLAMEFSRGRLVIFGDATEIESKLVVLGAIEDQLDGDWTQLDLRVPTRPAYR
ncbi:MAG: FtsQ-type POTRA domain-containing protein [Thermomicrobiales bacterium]